MGANNQLAEGSPAFESDKLPSFDDFPGATPGASETSVPAATNFDFNFEVANDSPQKPLDLDDLFSGNNDTNTPQESK